MSEPVLDVARRLIELFNRNFGQGRFEVDDETRALYADEPLIVPLRAALEGTRYEGASALDDFAADSGESWSWIRIDEASARELDVAHVLVTGTLTGLGRESGAEVRSPTAWLIEVEGGRIVAARTFSGEREALEAARR